MDKLPPELLHAILWQNVLLGPKSHVLQLRFVCTAFDRILKPYACRTLGLDFTRLSKLSPWRRPRFDALQTIGYNCTSLYIDMMVLRDDDEIDYLDNIFASIPNICQFFPRVRTKYCLSDVSLTEMDFYEALDTILFNCRGIKGLRLNLPFQLVGRHTKPATMILANTLKAFRHRPIQGSSHLRSMVLENLTDETAYNLWMNPCDVSNFYLVLEYLENLVISLRHHDYTAIAFGTWVWCVISNARRLQTLCLLDSNHKSRRVRGLKQTKYGQMPRDEWRRRSLPAPVVHSFPCDLTCLELTGFNMHGTDIIQILDAVSGSLQELYLRDIYLKLEQSQEWNSDCTKVLWIGLPNQIPCSESIWIAVLLRRMMTSLRVCRASNLAYDHYIADDSISVSSRTMPADMSDPCCRARNLSQRFVEVVTGVLQPKAPSGEAVEYFHHKLGKVTDMGQDVNPDGVLLAIDFDVDAYQVAVANTTSQWLRSIEGLFDDGNPSSLQELHQIANVACLGMNELQRTSPNATGDDNAN
ncbi:hypothetical protein CDD81_5457 [Ophiocordyceps australis]|uniref:Uncharacterized protein n=1 Tax=Ophiocordyceps australis TaxID=1399860 RepID=A0A2C5Y8P4_9HYPO|nr:hypothetical protein CDD81_5457 [Ophiocordyceps australis]